MTSKALSTAGALKYVAIVAFAQAAAAAASAPTSQQAKCSLTFDELNCVNATIFDLPKVTQTEVKELRFLESEVVTLKKGDLVHFPNLTDFVCLDCSLMAIDGDALWDLKNLIRLELYGNYLTLIDANVVKSCGKIKDFTISWNPTLVLPENGPFLISPTLRSLELMGNKLTALFPATFSKVPGLKNLTLAANLFRYLSPEVFAPLKNLRSLDLSRNKLTEISLLAFPTRVTEVRLAWNPWRCDCALYPVIQWSRTRDFDQDVRCFQPRRVKWTEFEGLNCTSAFVEAIRQRKMGSHQHS